jgi:hypothetical protein
MGPVRRAGRVDPRPPGDPEGAGTGRPDRSRDHPMV